MHGQKIRAREDFIERREFQLKVARLVRRDEWIISDDVHSKGSRATRDDAPDSPQTNNAEGLALQLNANETLALPTPVAQTAIRLRHSARQRHEQSHRVLGGRDGVSIRRIHD